MEPHCQFLLTLQLYISGESRYVRPTTV